MAHKLKNIPFKGTPEQEAALRATIEEMKDVKGALMPVMQKAQEIYGYLPIEVLCIISDGMNVPLEKIYGVATFYSQFTLQPKGQHSISCCLGTACYVKGANLVFEKIQEELGIGPGESTEDGVFTLESCRCVGACGLAPVVMIDDTVYGRMTPEKVPEMLGNYR